jgi:hypothetical protein
MGTYYMAGDEREDVITVRLNKDERRMVSALAGVDGISISDVVRMSIRRAHADRFGEIRKPARRKGMKATARARRRAQV